MGDKTRNCIESLCHKGCDSVREAIRLLQVGDDVAETRTLDETQRAVVLKELQAIMAVYDKRSDVFDDDSTNGR